ncbi:hypothetical protein [Streptomyces sp. KL116D]|uniref:hypothetical protein n=1 Tax=Streptomyces sp. KL116D TaxID=3045152 RepID=UPI0035565DA5
MVCPRCGVRATAAQRPGLPELRYAMELLCGAAAGLRGLRRDGDWEAERRGSALTRRHARRHATTDFGRPRCGCGRLREPCAVGVRRTDHVDALASHVGAHLRERGPASRRR